jgi:hypothetical protein
MELNKSDFLGNKEIYYMLRTKNYSKTKIKYSKSLPLLTLYKIFVLKTEVTEYENKFENLINKILIEKDKKEQEKLFIITFNFNNENIILIYTGLTSINDNFINKFIESDEKYQRKRFKILPVINSNSKLLNFLSKDNRPIMLAKKTETKFINNKNYFLISINLYKNLIIKGVINKIKSNSKGFKFNLGFTIETKKEDNLKEELYASVTVNNLEEVYSKI